MSGKIRVYELARDLNVDNKVAVTKLKALGIEVASLQSTISEEQAEKFRNAVNGASASTTASSAANAAKAAAGGPKVVIRRRKAETAETPAEETPAAAATPEKTATSPTVSATSGTALPKTGQAAATTPASSPYGLARSSASSASSAASGLSALNKAFEAPPKAEAPQAPKPSEKLEATKPQVSTPAAAQPSQAPVAASAGATATDKPAKTEATVSAKAPDVSVPTTHAPLSTGGAATSAHPSPGLPPSTVTHVSHGGESVAQSSSLGLSAGGMSAPMSEAKTSTASTLPPAVVPGALGAKAPEAAPAMSAVDARRRATASAGATIIRRASPEEIEASRQAALAQAAQRGSRTTRKEDSRGTRVTGMGLLSTAERTAKAAGAAGFVAEGEDKEEGWERRKEEKERRPAFEEEEAAPKPKTSKLRRANATLSMRALLSAADEVEGEEEDPAVPAAVVPVAVVPVEAYQAPRHVYTPTAPRGRREAKRRKDLKKTQITTPRAAYRVVKMEGHITVGELARQMSIKAADIIKKLMAQGLMVAINADLDADTATLLATEYGFEVESAVTTIEDILGNAKETDPTKLITRAPIVTVMGHVDHGKTSILDAIRQTNVAGGEAGGITQAIGAYQVERNGKKITFLDTPGHEAFSAMRARGAKMTDIVVLVVAADDGVMPQTVEAISHAKEANVPMIVAINKIDKPQKNLDRVFSELTERGVQSEEWGGETQFVKVSALQKTGIEELLEAILLQAEVLDLKVNPNGFASGTVVEAHLDRGRGPVATVMVHSGTLKTGDFVVAGTQSGRIRAMINHLGKNVASAGPATPVEVLGLSAVPQAGDRVDTVVDEKTARDAADWRSEKARNAGPQKSSAQTLEDLLGRIQTAEKIEVPLIIKADTQGSVEAIAESIGKIDSTKVSGRIVFKGAGGITESDVQLAKASGSLVIGFNVRAQRGLDDTAEKDGVIIKYFSIIYDLVDTVKAVMAGKLPPVVKEVVLGHAEVRQSISVPKIGTIAGSAVLDGKISRNSHLRLIRDNVVIYTGKIGSLRRFKDDVREVASGYECGIGIDGYNDIRVGDVMEAFALEESAATL